MGSWLALIYLYPVLISLSAIFTKQHYLADIPPGFVFGWLAHAVSGWIVS